MSNLNKISFLKIKILLRNHNIDFFSKLKDSDMFESLNSVFSAKFNDLTFISNDISTNLIKKINAKAVLVNQKI